MAKCGLLSTGSARCRYSLIRHKITLCNVLSKGEIGHGKRVGVGTAFRWRIIAITIIRVVSYSGQEVIKR